MLRRTPMKRTAFKRVKRKEPTVERLEHPVALSTVRAISSGTYVGGVSGEAVAKEQASQNAAYMAAVRTLPCMHCGIASPIQFAHADQGKGIGIKTDVRRGAPLCGPHDGKPGCHWLIGTSGTFTKEQRRDLEDEYGRRTRAAILAAGVWPKKLPTWKEKNQ